MKKLRGIAVLLCAILLQLCSSSSGLEPLTLALGAAGLALTFVDDKKAE